MFALASPRAFAFISFWYSIHSSKVASTPPPLFVGVLRSFLRGSFLLPLPGCRWAVPSGRRPGRPDPYPSKVGRDHPLAPPPPPPPVPPWGSADLAESGIKCCGPRAPAPIFSGWTTTAIRSPAAEPAGGPCPLPARVLLFFRSDGGARSAARAPAAAASA